MILFKKAECSKSVQDRVARAGASVEQGVFAKLRLIVAELNVPCAVCVSTLKDSWQGVLTEKVKKKPIISIYSIIKKACFLIFVFVSFFPYIL